ncbi:hypothetical protein ACH4UR_25420 [Streptomyces lydicus]|uniref:hypothetical protein n=1 Tax=Streptomyces lydicus TaxID=47763 RepID=UPI0033C95F7A
MIPQGTAPTSIPNSPELAIKVTRTDGGTTLIGPIPFQHIADHMVLAFKSMAHNTTGADGARYEVSEFSPRSGETYLPLVPASTDAITSLMDDTVQGVEAPFPDLWSRLHAQHGYETACRAWRRATIMVDLFAETAEAEESEPSTLPDDSTAADAGDGEKTMHEHRDGEPLHLSAPMYATLLDIVQAAAPKSHAQGDTDPCRQLLSALLATLGIAPPPPAVNRTLCPSLYCDESGTWAQCQHTPGHPVSEPHAARWGFQLTGQEWCDGHPRSLTPKRSADDVPPPREYKYCGATNAPDDEPTYTCNRRVAHKGKCSPDHDED